MSRAEELDYYSVKLKNPVNDNEITVPVFNENDTFLSEKNGVRIEYSFEDSEEDSEEFLKKSAEEYENHLKEEGFTNIKNSGLLVSESGVNNIGIFCKRDETDYQMYYAIIESGKGSYLTIKVESVNDEENEAVLDSIIKELGLKKLIQYEKNESLQSGYTVSIGKDDIDLPLSLSELLNDGWSLSKETPEGDDTYSVLSLEKEGYVCNINVYNENDIQMVFGVSVLSYRCSSDSKEVSILEGKIRFGSSSKEVEEVLDSLKIKYSKKSLSSNGIYYVLEDSYGSGYEIVLMKNSVYSIKVVDMESVFDEKLKDEEE